MKLSESERQARDLRMAYGILREPLPRAEIELYHLASFTGTEMPKLERVKIDQLSSST